MPGFGVASMPFLTDSGWNIFPDFVFPAGRRYSNSMPTREDLRRQYLSAMGIELWEKRRPSWVAPCAEDTGSAITTPPEDLSGAAVSAALSVINPKPQASPSPVELGELDWEALQQAVRACTQCSLHLERTQTVFGVGNRHAQWMFVGEAPGVEEDRQGEPFVGRAGQLLNAMIHAIGLKREAVYIANVLKCRPPNNRDPQPDEVEHCEPFLLRQIELIKPRLLVALGRHAAHSLLKTELALGKLRGQRLSYHDIPLVVTYHPAYLLRNPVDKRKAWDDLRLARSIVEAAQ